MPPRSKSKKKTENPPIFSHESIILNHGDIFATFLLLVFASSISQWECIENISRCSNYLLFLNNEANVTDPENENESLYREFFYKSAFDYVQAVFYVTVFIVIHCIYQEYFVDKIMKKLKNSSVQKKKSANDSFLMFLWHSVNTFSVFSMISQVGFQEVLDFSDYPQQKMFSYSSKFFFILQISHWLHTLPELYLSRATKDQYKLTLKTCLIYCTLFIFAYETHLSKLALLLTFLDSFPKSVFHLARLAKYYEINEISSILFQVWNIVGWLCPMTALILITKLLVLGDLDTSEVFRFTKQVAVVLAVLSQVYQLVLFTRSLEKSKIQDREAMKVLKDKQKEYKQKEIKQKKVVGKGKKAKNE